MTKHPISLDLKSAELPLASIYLDPNNPRFAGRDSKLVHASRIDKDEVQEEARKKMIGEFETEKVRSSIEVNGYLPLDRIVVKEFKDGRFVVLEGNRRSCAAKTVDGCAEDGTTVPDSVLRSLVKIPCLIYTGKERDAAWILQGLRHISGVRPWSSPLTARARAPISEQGRRGRCGSILS